MRFLSSRERKGNEKCIKKQKGVQESHGPNLTKNESTHGLISAVKKRETTLF